MAKAKKTPSGKWRCLVFNYTDEHGKRHYKSFTADTKKEAEYQASEFLLTETRGEITYENMTVGQAYDAYIKSKSAVLSPSTVAGYKRSRNNHFKKLMPIKLHNLTPQMVQAAINEMSADHAPKTVRNAHGLLHAVLKTYAPRLELNTRLPQRIKPQYIIPTTEDIKKLLDTASANARVPILLAAYGSLRRSEISALTPDDFTDFGVNINKAAVFDSDKKLIIKTTKTTAGTRFVPLPREIIAEARSWQRFGATPNSITGYFIHARDKADLPKFSFHKLRHYWASELHAQGVPDQYICKVGGWESVDMLHKIYQHTLKDHENSMSEKIVNIFTEKLKKYENATQNATRAN